MRRSTLGGALLAAVLLLGACSDGDSDDAKDAEGNQDDTAETETTDTSVDEPSINPDAPEADSQFCKDATELVTGGDATDEEAMSFAESLEPPEEIAQEWTAMIAGARAVTEAEASGDPEAAAKATEAYAAMNDDVTKVLQYLQEQCGIDAGV
jgi:hypothetical protein